MNIAFLLTPKNEVVTLKNTMTMRQALEKMEYHKFSAVPVLDELGRYVYTLSEGDLIWHLKQHSNLTLKGSEQVDINTIERSRTIEAVSINEEYRVVFEITKNQNFVPVVDDSGVFIGIVKRSEIMSNTFFLRHSFEPYRSDEQLLRA